MEEKQKSQLVAEAENVEAIRDFFSEWWSVQELYETAAKASSVILDFLTHVQYPNEDIQLLNKFIEQHMMMIQTIKPFAKKDEPEK